MEILRSIKNTNATDQHSARSFIHCLQIQILLLFLLKEFIPVYESVLKIQSFEDSSIEKLFVLGNFVFNIFLIGYFCLRVSKIYRNMTNGVQQPHLNKKMVKVFNLIPYIGMVQIVRINLSFILSIQLPFTIFSFFNISIILIQILALKVTNISYRFEDFNYLKRKRVSLLAWLMIFPIILSVECLEPINTCALMFVRSLIQLYGNFVNLQNEIVRQLEYFYPFCSISITLAYAAKIYLKLTIFGNFIQVTFFILFLFYCSSSLTQCMLMFSLRFHLKRYEHLFQLKNQNSSLEIFSNAREMDSSQIDNFVLFLRILAKVYHTRMINDQRKYSGFQNMELQSVIRNYDYWWSVFNLTILKHKVQCYEVTCECKKLSFRNKQNPSIEDNIFLLTMSSLFARLADHFNLKNQKLSIIQKYFIVEFQNKPIKAYHHLVKLYQEKLSFEENLEVEALINETREIFEKIFLVEKVQNQNLNIEPILEFEQNIKGMKTQLSIIALNCRKFYQHFTTAKVSVKQLKKTSKQLSQLKRNLNQKIDRFLLKFDRNLQFLNFCTIYFKYFDEYTRKDDYVERKMQHLMEKLTDPFYEFKKKDKVDIFNPLYGAIKMDLTNQTGVVLSVTKNVCQLLGHSMEEIIGQKVNKLMPHIFSRFHDKFLNNFVELGTFSTLKQKERIFYAKSSDKFIIPITVRLKVDYLLNYHTFSASALIHKMQTKSEFILMNNYGKIEEVSEGIFRLFFKQALRDEIVKAKRLCMYKMLLPLNYLIQNLPQTGDQIYEGIIMTSDDQKSLNAFFKSPQFSRYSQQQNEQNEQISAKSRQMSNVSHTSKRTIDYSQDYERLRKELKQSFRQFLRIYQPNKIRAYRITFKFYEIITREFKCKVLEILSIVEQLNQTDTKQQLAPLLLEVGQFYQIEKEKTEGFKTLHSIRATNNQDNSGTNSHFSVHLLKDQQDIRPKLRNRFKKQLHESYQQDENSGRIFKTAAKIQSSMRVESNNFQDGQSSHFSSSPSEFHLKESVITAFQKKEFINQNAEIAIILLIICLAFTFGAVCLFSMRLEDDYKRLELDNLIVANVRLNFQFRLAIHEMEDFYGYFGLSPPAYVTTKKQLLIDDLKSILQNSINWINYELSHQLYLNRITFDDQQQKFQQNRELFFAMNRIYAIFRQSQKQNEYLSDNYISINSYLNRMFQKQRDIILQASMNFRNKIHTVVSIYLVLLISLVVVFVLTNIDASKKENRVVDFLPFIHVEETVKNLLFYEKVYEYLKDKNAIDMDDIQCIQRKVNDGYDSQMQKFRSSENKKPQTQEEVMKQAINSLMTTLKRSKKLNIEKSTTSTRLIHLQKSQQKLITAKNIFFFCILMCLCVSVVLYSEIFFSVAHEKFNTYLVIKDAALLIESIPPRLMLLYLKNLHAILVGDNITVFPEEFYEIGHDFSYRFRANVSSVELSQTEMAQMINKHISVKICKLVDCSVNSSTLVQTQILGYLSIQFKNIFDYMRLVKDILPKNPKAKDEIVKWINQNHVFEMLQATENVLDVVKMSERQSTRLFESQIKSIGSTLFWISVAMVPLLVFIIILIRRKFIKFVATRIQTTENIYRQFSWKILSKNSYALNYFEQKLKSFRSS